MSKPTLCVRCNAPYDANGDCAKLREAEARAVEEGVRHAALDDELRRRLREAERLKDIHKNRVDELNARVLDRERVANEQTVHAKNIRVQLREAEQDRDELNVALQEALGDGAELVKEGECRIAKAEARAGRLVNFLTRYGSHDSICRPTGEDCPCGFREALREARREET